MSLMSHTVSSPSTQRISYSKANDFIKLLDEERPAHELSGVLSPGTYQIGSGDGIIQWNGQIAYHAPPNGEVETFDYLKKSGNGGGFGALPSQGNGGGTNGMGGLLHEVAAIQNGRSGGLQSAFQRGQEQPVEMESPWSRGWAEAERQEQVRR